MSSDPFFEPGDSDRTLIRPVPGGRASAAAAKNLRPGGGGAAPPVPTAAPAAAVDTPPTTPPATLPGTPLAVAAAPLLQLLARLRNTAHQPDPGNLYERAVRALRDFEQRGRAAGVPMEQLRPAHYALCASIDDAVLNTPWGAASAWTKRPLAASFHQDTTEGDQFFDILARLQATPGAFLPVIEVMYLCLSLGFMGRRYRQSPRGPGEITQLRAVTCALIAKQRNPETELSPRWLGIAAPYARARGGVPVWVVYAAALAVCGGLFVWVSTSLNAASDDQYNRMLAAPPAHVPQILRPIVVQPPPPPPPPPEPDALDRLRTALKADIDKGAVSIIGTPATPILRVSNRGGFAAGGAVLQPPLVAVLQRIGTALKAEPGPIQVISYTDSEPIRTVQFPSNFQLSAARAQAARSVLARALGDAARLSAEGRADADPIASNATADGREQNRRIEIVLHREG
jgi:type VI secretion system protein ImpK